MRAQSQPATPPLRDPFRICTGTKLAPLDGLWFGAHRSVPLIRVLVLLVGSRAGASIGEGRIAGDDAGGGVFKMPLSLAFG